MDNEQGRPPANLTRKRFIAGAAIFFTGQAVTLTIPLVLMTGLPAGLKTAASVVLFFVIPSMFTLSAIVVLGRPGFGYLKGLIVRWFRKEPKKCP